MIRTVCLALASVLVSVSAASAQADPANLASEAASEFGPAVGATAPAFSATDASGTVQDLASLSAANGVVIYFNRSLSWCPICLRQTLELEAAKDQFAQAGWGLAVLTYDDQETLARVQERRELTLTLLADPEITVIDAFEIRDPIYADPDHLAHGVPYPIAIAIRPNGEVAGKFWHEAGLGQDRGYAVRVSVEDVLGALN